MAREGFVFRFLEPCAVAVFMTILAACGDGGGGEVAPPAVQPVSMAISGLPTASMQPGQSAQLTATLTYSDSSTRDVTTTATWSTSNAAVLSLSSAGTIVAVAPGQAEVIASMQGLSSRGSVRVERPVPQPVSLAISGVPMGSMTPGQSVQLTATLTYPDGSTSNVTATAAWSTSNAAVATVSSAGVLQAVAPGQAEVVASTQGLSRPALVTVTAPAPLPVALAIGGVPSMAMAPGQMAQLSATLTYSDGSTAEVTTTATWGSSDTSVIAVSSAGALIAVAPGQADVIARAQELSSRSTVVVAQPTAALALFAGNLGGPGSSDGLGADARFNDPTALVTDGTGNVYVADTRNCTIRKIGPSGSVTTFAGTPGFCSVVDGTGSEAGFKGPYGLAIDGAGNLYAGDWCTVRKITPSRAVSTWAGTPGECWYQDGTGPEAHFGETPRLASDSAGNIYAADTSHHTIRKITPARVVSTFAGTPDVSGSADGTGADARFNLPWGIAVDGEGNVYVADMGNYTLRKISPARVVTTVAGSPGLSGQVDATGSAARFGQLLGAATDAVGNVYVADGARIRKVTPSGVVSTFAGGSICGSTDGPGETARFGAVPFEETSSNYCTPPYAVASDRENNIYVADTGNHTVRKITPSAMVSTLAGNPLQWGLVDGASALARFGNCWAVGTLGDSTCAGPGHVTVDGTAHLYVADHDSTGSPRIRRITPAAAVTTLTSADQPWPSPTGTVKDSAGNVYAARPWEHTIAQISPSFLITTFAGTANQRGSADGVGAAARFNEPQGIAIDSKDNLYVADRRNHTIRKITPAGVVTTVVGTAGRIGFVAGPLPGGLSLPYGVSLVGTSLFITMENGVAVVTNVP